MPQLLIRDVDEQTKRALAIKAAQNGQSLQKEMLSIITNAAKNDADSSFEYLFVSYLDESAQKELSRRAKEKQRTPVEEAVDILQSELGAPKKSMWEILSQAGQYLDDEGLELPERSRPRDSVVEVA